MTKATASTAVAAAVVALLVGCTPTVPQPSLSDMDEAMRVKFEVELGRELSEYSRGIIADFEISGAEYQESNALYVECVNEAFPARFPPPFATVVQPDGSIGHSFVHMGESQELVDTVEADCLYKFAGDGAIPYLYWESINNSHGVPLEQLILDCLIAKGLVDPEEYGRDEVAADILADLGGALSGNVGAQTDLDMSTGEAFNCYAFQN